MIFYELWDLRSRNIIGTYPTEANALGVVSEAMVNHGRTYVEDLALGWADDEDETRGGEIASGLALAERAENQCVA